MPVWCIPAPMAPTTPWERSSASAGYPWRSASSKHSSASWRKSTSTRSAPMRVSESSTLRSTPSREKSLTRRCVAGTWKLSSVRPRGSCGTRILPTLVDSVYFSRGKPRRKPPMRRSECPMP
ncbi:hypothetical protein SAMN05192584_111105 [Streptomyces pini]|uniref:Uncharacterized protein n=1 Tax=Streptomyces pini TaxID=1520580 RepID=A0A1I4E2R7_9ACTN|nr:hypothetical protein SAMN05192584_111105 [Streptomyces pini]